MNDNVKIEVIIQLNKCADCEFLMMEEVDYDYFITEDGTRIAIPKGSHPPCFVCTREAAETGKLLSPSCLTYHDPNSELPEAGGSCDFYKPREDEE